MPGPFLLNLGEHHEFIEDKILEAAEELDHVVSEMNSLLRDPQKDVVAK